MTEQLDTYGLLARTVELNASDLYLSAHSKPMVALEGELKAIGDTTLTSHHNKRLIDSVLSDAEQHTFEATNELNKSLYVEGTGRFRVNVFRQRGEPALVARYIKGSVPPIEALGLPPGLKDLINEPRGLVLVVGGTGTGKSTTLASMIDHRNNTRSGHILTIEDPIEFLHQSKKSLVNQREVGTDTESYGVALKNAMREAPHLIFIGEIRDEMTMRHAIAYAETGHLCVSTLHANNANQALSRIINFFPDDSHQRILQDLSLNLRAIIAQRLCRGVDKGRVPAVELMINTAYIASLIEKRSFGEIRSVMEKSRGRLSQTFDQCLFTLAMEGKITREEALRNADSANNLRLRFKLEGGASPARVYPVKSEFVVSKKAPFDTYDSYRVVPVRIEVEDKSVADRFIEALHHAMASRGLEEDREGADIEVQFMVGLKTAKGMQLPEVAEEKDAVDYYVPESEFHHMLIVNIVDRKLGKPVYRLTASRPKTENVMSQQELNDKLAELLESFPRPGV